MRILLMSLLFLYPLIAQAEITPRLNEGQYVYSLPEGYAPPGINKAQLNQQLAKLHAPFYVFIVKEIGDLSREDRAYARENKFVGDDATKQIEVFTAKLIESLAAQPEFDSNRASVFVLASSPRKFAWHPSRQGLDGAKLTKSRQKPFTEKFTSRAKTRPADYGAAIFALAKPLDEYIFDRTDPERLAAREKARAEAEERAALARARGELDAHILKLRQMLEAPAYMPEDPKVWHTALGNAMEIRMGDDPLAIASEVESFGGRVAVLERAYNEKQTEARTASLIRGAKFLAGILLLLVLAWWIRRWVLRWMETAEQYTEAIAAYEAKVRNASERWADAYTERRFALGLKDTSGATARLMAEVTDLVDQLRIRIAAMEDHAVKTRMIMKGIPTLGKLRAALAHLSETFVFDTGETNVSDLFGAETVRITITPHEFDEVSAKLFAQAAEGWAMLKKAAQIRHTAPAVEDGYDKLREMVDRLGFTPGWFHKIPPAPTEQMRQEDPVAFLNEHQQRLKSIEKATRKTEEWGTKLFTLKRWHQLPAYKPSTELSPAMYESRYNTALAGTKAALIAGEIDTAQKRYQEAQRAWEDARREIQSLQAAAQSGESLQSEATKAKAKVTIPPTCRYPSAEKLRLQALTTRDTALSVFADAQASTDYYARARGFEKAIGYFNDAISFVQRCMNEESKQKQAEQEFVNLQAALPQRHGELANQCRRYGVSIGAYSAPTVLNQDFADALTRVQRQQAGWEASLAEGRRRAAAEEERRRRDEAAAAAAAASAARYEEERRRSSSSSYGGGGFGGSSGGYDSGGFGGSSGDY